MAKRSHTVGASLRGHAFHHAWAARSTLALLEPGSDLEQVVVENFSEEDAPGMSAKAVEVADLVRYFGGRCAADARLVEVVQFKHSDAEANAAFRASDAAKTIGKFAVAFANFAAEVGPERRDEVVRFVLTTNRPIHPDLEAAVSALAAGNQASRRGVSGQMAALTESSALAGEVAQRFFSLVRLSGSQGSLRIARQGVGRVIASWSAPSDLDARHRLKELLELVNDAATGRAQLKHTIIDIDVLGALNLADPDDLFPAMAAFPPVANPIPRAALDKIVAQIDANPLPLVVHATGGMGKTVLMQALAERLDRDGLSILFDGFGGGEWRNPADTRHRASGGLLQLVNQIAARGLCDPILPGRIDPLDLLKTARNRLRAAAEALKCQGRAGGLSLLLDAVDHSAEAAALAREESFAFLLLKSLSVSPIDGVRLVLSCRTQRLSKTKGDARCQVYPVPPFQPPEVLRLIRAAYPGASPTDVATLTSRAQGNPRILAALLRQGPPFEPRVGPPPNDEEALNALLQQQLDEALEAAVTMGADGAELEAMLAGLALMPPPTPVEELAIAQGLSTAAVQSFVADMFPLLEGTASGVIFRDEPTEEYVRKRSDADPGAQAEVLRRLDERQAVSSYAARAYPVVLRNLKRKAELYALALDDRIPVSATSDVARRAVRAARLDAALSLAAQEGDHDELFTLALETARLAGGQGRSARFVREHPDLIAASGDAEARRRIYEDQSAWGGARHATRAVAAYFEGEWDEAHREARRALDWFNWWIEQHRSHPEDSKRLPDLGDLDVEGPAFVMCRNGGAARMVDWLQGWGPALAYRHLSGVVSLVERAAAVSPTDAQWRDRAYRLLARSGKASPLTLLAILAHAPRITAETVDALTAALVEADLAGLDQQYDPMERKPDLTAVLVSTAAREVAHGRPDRAARLLAMASIRRPSQYEFDPPILARGSIETWLVRGLLQAALEDRPFDLEDVAPREVEEVLRRRGDRDPKETYRDSVLKALAEPPKAAADESQESRAAREDSRRRLETCLKSRLPELISMLESLRPLVRAGDFSAAVEAAAKLIREDVPKVSAYPYSDQKQFLALSLSGVAGVLGKEAGGVTSGAAVAMTDALVASPAHYLPHQVRWVRVFVLVPETVSVAENFATAIGDVSVSDDSIDSRLGTYSDLAYALWGASPAESAAYVRTALEKADGLSGDDYEESQGLISIAAQYDGPPLAQEIVHGFARLCEAQMPHDEDRYNWREFSQALSRIGGLDGLAISSRMEDRGKGGLEYNQLMLPAYLVERGKLAPELSVALIGLKSYRDFYVFRLTDFLAKVLPKLDAAGRERALEYAAVEWDRASLSGISRDLAALFVEQAGRWLPPAHPLLDRFKTLAEGGSPTDPEPLRGLRSDEDDEASLDIARRLDTASPESFDASLEDAAFKGDEPRLSAVLQALGRETKTVEARLSFAQAVAGSRSLSLSEKLWGLTEHLKAWATTSHTLRQARRGLVETLLSRHVETFMAGRWDSGYELRRLLDLGGDALSEADAVVFLLRHVRPSQVQNRTAWLDAAARLAPIVDGARLQAGLVRYVTRSAATLEPEAHGGAWSPGLAVDNGEAVAVAGLVWKALGSVREENRWRAAHVVRRLVAVGRLDVVACLIEMFEREDAAPCQWAKTPFRFLDGRLWMLLALDRIALERPNVVAPYRGLFTKIISDQALPHVLMREVAGRTLEKIIASAGPRAGEPDPSSINQSPFAERLVSNYLGDGYYHGPPEGYVALDPPFHFDYDFDKTEVMGVARIFSAHKYETGDHIAGWIRRWEPEAANMWGGDRGGWDRTPVTETWTGHLGWHGLFLTAGDFLKTRPLVATEWRPDPMRSFLDQELLVRRDGYWLADDNGLTPPDVYLPRRHRDHLPRRSTLPRRVGLGCGTLDEVVVSGTWNSRDEVEFWVRSAFVRSAEAEAAAAALALSSSYDVWLPLQSDLDDYGHRGAGPFIPWLTATDFTWEAGLDLKDPYGSAEARSGVKPVDAVINAFDLVPEMPFERRWKNAAGRVVIRTDVWGGRDGRGRHETDRSGRRTYANAAFLRELCRELDAVLVVLTYARIYLKGRNDGDAFPGRWSVSLLGTTGPARPLVRTTRRTRQVVAALDRESRREFDEILSAVTASLS